MSYDCGASGVDYLTDLDVGACIFYENTLVKKFNISFESTCNKL